MHVALSPSQKLLIFKEKANEISVSIPSTLDINETLNFPLSEGRVIFEKEYLINQLKKFGGNISKTAKFVGMERSALHRKLKTLGIKGVN